MSTSTQNIPQTVLVKQRSEGDFVARSSQVPDFSGQGATEAEALARLRDQLVEYFSTAKLVTIDVAVPKQENPWTAGAGLFHDDPNAPGILEELKRQREQDREASSE